MGAIKRGTRPLTFSDSGDIIRYDQGRIKPARGPGQSLGREAP